MSIIKDIKANSCQLSLFPDMILPLMTTEGRGCGSWWWFAWLLSCPPVKCNWPRSQPGYGAADTMSGDTEAD